MRRLALPFALAALALAAPSADAAYTGSVDQAAKTVTLTGSSRAPLSTGGGLLHHGNLGPGFSSGADFDSASAGEQQVPDSSGWAVNISGGGGDTLDIQEGETLVPLSYAFGHTFFPGGVPCVVRDPNDRAGAIVFSRHPAEETRFCYPGGFKTVTVRAGEGAAEFAVLDTEPGVTVRVVGGRGDDFLTEAANVPSSVDESHNPESPVHFAGGRGNDYVTLNDGPVSAPATYRIEKGAIRKTGLPPLYFDRTVEGVVLYPQDGPSKIVLGPTGGAWLQVFGGFHGQHGPDTIDGRFADAPMYVTGSSGGDTFLGTVFQDYFDGGGGDDWVDARDASFDQVLCRGGFGPVAVDSLDRITDCPNAKVFPRRIALARARFTPKKVRRGKRLKVELVSTAPGKVTLTFRRGSKRLGSRKLSVKLGPSSHTLKSRIAGRALAKGRYKVSAQLRTASGRRSKPVTLRLTIR